MLFLKLNVKELTKVSFAFVTLILLLLRTEGRPTLIRLSINKLGLVLEKTDLISAIRVSLSITQQRWDFLELISLSHLD